MNPEDIQSSGPPEPPILPEMPIPPPRPEPPEPVEPETRVPNTLPVTQPGERTICTIHRHPIGILSVYIMSGLALIITAVLAFIVAPGVFNSNSTQAIMAGALVFVIVAAICVAYCIIAAKIYWGNSWTLTTDSITQVNQKSLLKRQSGQLALDNLEDVTVEQDGMLAHMFNYGVLRVETAGQSSKFIFPFCPNPNYYAEQALTAREAFEQNRRGSS